MSFRLSPEEASARSIASAYKPDPDELCLVEQQHRDSCDINVIMRQYEKSGLITHVAEVDPSYGDFTTVNDFHSAVNQIKAAEAAFMTLDARLRKRFDNDPGKFLAFIEDDANRPEAEELGLVAKRPIPDATLKDVVEAVKGSKAAPKKKPLE